MVPHDDAGSELQAFCAPENGRHGAVHHAQSADIDFAARCLVVLRVQKASGNLSKITCTSLCADNGAESRTHAHLARSRVVLSPLGWVANQRIRFCKRL